jgi:ADP-glucose pyrophosphorylase
MLLLKSMVEENTNPTEEQENTDEVSIDLEIFSKEELIKILVEMAENDMTFSQYMESCVDEMIEKMEERSK